MSLRSALLTWLLGLGGVCVAWPTHQDPPPKPAPSSPPVDVAPATPIPGKPPTHPLEGVYELRQRVVDGASEVVPSTGYLAITHKHMFLCMAGPGAASDRPLLRSGVRTWRPDGELLRSETKIGYYTDADGGVHVDAPGTAEVRRFLLERGLIRIYQDDRSYLEFERVE